jgi:hypothetical protein
VIANDFLQNGPCYQFNSLCASTSNNFLCPDLSGVRTELSKICNSASSMQSVSEQMSAIGNNSLEKYEEVRKQCAATTGKNYSQTDLQFGKPDANLVLAGAQHALGNNAGAQQAILRAIAESRSSTMVEIKQISSQLGKMESNILRSISDLDLSIQSQFRQFQQFMVAMTDEQFGKVLDKLAEVQLVLEANLPKTLKNTEDIKELLYTQIQPSLQKILFNLDKMDSTLLEIEQELSVVVSDYRNQSKLSDQAARAAELELQKYIAAQSTRLAMQNLLIAQCDALLAQGTTCLLNPELPICKSIQNWTPLCK